MMILCLPVRLALALGLSLLPPLTATGQTLANENPSEPTLLPDQDRPLPGRTTIIVALGLGAAAALSKSTDIDHRFVEMLDDTPLDGAIDGADRYGDGATLGFVALGMMGVGRATGNPGLQATGEDLTTSLLAAWAATWAIKVTVDARRPSGGAYSFPSGHTATAFAAAPVFSRHFGPVVGTAAYLVASLTGLARMEEEKHYPVDVLVGAAIGIVAGNVFTRDSRLQWAIPTRSPGLGLNYRF